MRRFTGSPYEKMMGQGPEAGRPIPPPMPLLQGRCHGCPYGQARSCIGICIKDVAGSNTGRTEKGGA